MAKKKKKEYRNYENNEFLTPTDESLQSAYNGGSRYSGNFLASEDTYQPNAARDALIALGEYKSFANDGESFSDYIQRRRAEEASHYRRNCCRTDKSRCRIALRNAGRFVTLVEVCTENRYYLCRDQKQKTDCDGVWRICIL